MKEAIQLLQYWQEYSERAVKPEMANFSVWLAEKFNVEKNDAPELPKTYAHSINMSIGFLLGHLMAYGEIWTKLSFRDLPIQHFHDFGSLMFIAEVGNPTKKEIAKQSLQEQSSCFEALKRMGKQGLIEDFDDPQDKRVRRVSITAKGQSVLEEAIQQASRLSDLLVGDLTQQEKSDLIKVLTKLNTFHDTLYQSGGKEKAVVQYNL